MDQAEFDRVAASFAAFHAEFAPLFGRKEAQRRSEQYVRGLLVQQTDRRNAENVAEMIVGATPRTLQRLLTEAPWPTEPVIDRLQAYVGARLNMPEGIFVLDESGFPKQGKKSVGVARQYCGTLGKVGNCQVGVFLAYVSTRGHALVDKRLYLPPAWTDAPARCQAAGVPEGLGYRSMAELGLDMLRQARAAGHLQGHWVTGDDAYGKVPTLRDALDAEGWRYVLDVPETTPVFTHRAPVVVPPWSGRGPKPTTPRLAPAAAPADTPLLTLAQVAAARWVIETEIQTAKGETGLDEYEVRSWRSWHHHIVLALLAGAFLLTLQQDWGEKDAPDHAPASQPGAAGAAAASDVDTRRATPVAQRHPRAQRARQTLTHQASPPQAA